MQRGRDADRREVVSQRHEVAPQGRAEIGVDHRGAGPLVLADHGEDIARTGDEDIFAERAAQNVMHAPLVRRVGVGVQQADRDRLHLRRLEPLGRGHDRCLIERLPDLAQGAHPLVDFEAKAARHQRLRARVVEDVHLRDAEAAHFEHVAKAARGHETRVRALVLEDRVGRDRGRVNDALDLRGRYLQRCERIRERGDDPAAIIVGRRQRLLAVQDTV